jgi:hypothetical protein
MDHHYFLRSLTMYPNRNCAIDDISHKAAKAACKAKSFLNTAGHEVCDASHRVKSHVRTNPVESSLLAMGLGFIAQKFFNTASTEIEDNGDVVHHTSALETGIIALGVGYVLGKFLR